MVAGPQSPKIDLPGLRDGHRHYRRTWNGRAHATLKAHANRMTATGAVEEQIEPERRKNQNDHIDAEPSRRLRDGMAEEVSKAYPPAGPRQSA